MKLWSSITTRAGLTSAILTLSPALCAQPEVQKAIADWVTTDKGCKIWNRNLRPGVSATWTGKCENGLAEGDGTLNWYHNGELTVTEHGIIEHGHMSNEADVQFTLADGSRIAGHYKGEKLDGFGSYTLPNGDRYDGQFQDGLYNGYGTFVGMDGYIYKGQWKNGQPNGQGTLTDTDHSVYVGEMKNAERDGLGTVTFADGGKYEGRWKNDKRDGQGTLTLPNGKKIPMQFRDDKPVGSIKFDDPWQKYTTDRTGGVYYYNKELLKREGNIFQVWIKADHSYDKTFKFSEELSLSRYRCDDMSWTSLSYVRYNRMGRPIDSHTFKLYEQVSEPLPPDSIGMTLLKILCN